jgi:polyphosphate kinase
MRRGASWHESYSIAGISGRAARHPFLYLAALHRAHPRAEPMTEKAFTYLDRETSWLRFADRVLQEADDASVPLFERLFFCGIFSSNLDEYFRVRVASLRTLLRLRRADEAKLGIDPHRLLHDIHRIVLEQQERYGGILERIFAALAAEGIRLVANERVSPRHDGFLRHFFDERLRPLLVPIHLGVGDEARPFLKNHVIYLVVEYWEDSHRTRESWTPSYVLLEVPAAGVGRLVTLPNEGDAPREVMFLDDVIRYNLGEVFPGHEVGR